MAQVLSFSQAKLPPSITPVPEIVRRSGTPIRASELKRGQLAWSRTIDLVGTPPDRAPRSVLESPPAALGSWRLVSGR